MAKVRVATTSLAGCFGCHMSLLDIDERLLQLMEEIELNRTPLTDIKNLSHCDVGMIEGGVCNEENVEILRNFREKCTTLIAVGACAVNGGIPALRNHFGLEACLDEAYHDGMGLENHLIPNDEELPKLLNKVHPIQEVVNVDYFLPGCPPTAEAIWTFLNELLDGRKAELPYTAVHYD